MIDSLIAIFCLILLFSLAHLVGMLVVRGIASWQSGLEKLVFTVPFGMGVISYVILLFGLLGFFQSPFFYAILGLGILSLPIAINDLWRLRRLDHPGEKSRLLLTIAAVLGLLGFFILIAALAPPTEWDALSYHLAGPKTYLRHGHIFYIPYDHHTNFPFLLQMLYGLMLGVKSVGGAKLCHTLCGALMVASVYPFARRYLAAEGRGRRAGALAALFLATTPMVIWEMTVAYSDLATALYTWLALYALLNSRTGRDDAPSRSSQTWLTISAVLMGFALGTKFTVLAYWLMLMGGILGADLLTTRRLASATIRRALWWAAISLAVAAPWYLKTWLYTGNPTYPFLYSLFGGRYWNAANAAQYAVDQAHLGGGKSPADLITAPWAATMLPTAAKFTEYYTFALSPLLVAILLALPLLGRRLSRPIQIVGLFGAGVVAFWLLSVQQTRYVLPALPALALVCAEAVVLLWEIPAGRVEKWAVGALAGATTIWALYLAGGMAFWGVRDFAGNRVARPAWPVVSGSESRDEYVARGVLQRVGAAELWINQNTDTNAKVALFDTTFGFYLDRDYVWAQPDHAAGLIPWDDYRNVDDWLADFKRRGYTTLLLGARDPKAADDGKRWRTLVAEAVQSDKVTPVFAAPAGRGSDGEPIYVRVYQIP